MNVEKCKMFLKTLIAQFEGFPNPSGILIYEESVDYFKFILKELEGNPEKIKIGYDCDEDQEIIDALCLIQNKCVMDCGSIGCNNCRFGENNGDCLLAHRPRSWKINDTREFKFLK